MKKALSLMLAAGVLAGTLAGCGTKKTEDSAAPSTAAATTKMADDFTFGVYNFGKLDPADKYNGWSIVRYGVGETLFKLDDDLKVTPWLAKDYKFSDDKRSWTITLKDDIQFSNGKACDGAAVKACLERTNEKNERAKSQLKINAITADGNTLTIETTEPNPTLVNDLCDPYAAIIDVTADGDFETKPVGTGPYVVAEYVEDDHCTLTPNERYWDGTPACKTVTVKGISDVDTLGMALQNGEIDAAYGLSYDTLDTFKGDSKYAITQTATTRVYMLYFNLKHEYMDDANFRKAICMAVDKKSYCETLLNGAGTPTKSAFPSMLSYGDSAKLSDVPDYDIDGAKKLLADSGYTLENNALMKDGKQVSLKLVTYGRAGLPQSAQALQSALQTLGVKVEYQQYESVEDVLTADQFDICAYAMVTTPTGDPAAFLNLTMGSGGGSNYGHYSNIEVDALLSELNTEFDPDKRSQDALKIQQLALRDSSYSYMFHLNMFMVTKAGVTGITQSPVDYYQITKDTAKPAK